MQVTGSSYTHRFTLVPRQFFVEEDARNILSDAVSMESGLDVAYVDIPECGAVLLYEDTGDGRMPEVWFLLSMLNGISDYNKVIASFARGRLFLVIAEGRTLRLCNSYDAQDFTTAEYYIFLAMRRFQLNPEMSAIYFHTPLSEEQEMSLYRYFRSVEQR